MKYSLLTAICAIVLCFASCKKEDNKRSYLTYDNGPTDSLKLNQMQVIASHNSYHLRTDTPVFNFLVSLDSLGYLPAEYNPADIDYTHAPLQVQMSDYNVRGLELDIYNDPQGGNFYYRQGYSLMGADNDSHIEELKQPGFKIIHIPDFDFNSTNYTFVSALTDIKNWSLAHPNHLPIFINIETKEETPGDALPGLPGLTHSIPYDASACDQMDAEIKSVFGESLDKVITPDKVKGSYGTLREAVLAGNWPKLADARGKVVFIMQGSAETLYKNGHPSLSGRAMFVYSSAGSNEAAFVILNDPTTDFAEIQQRVAQGFIVRTRADAGTNQARYGDYTDMNAAFNSWAQIISTDYYRPDARAGTPGWSNYKVQFPNGELARIDSISASSQLNLGIIKE